MKKDLSELILLAESLKNKAHDLQSDLYNLQHDFEESDCVANTAVFEQAKEYSELAAFNMNDVWLNVESFIREIKS